MNFHRITQRAIFSLSKSKIKIISYINHRWYMKLYIPLLKKNGLQINGTPRYIGIHVSFDDFNKKTIGDRVVISDYCRLLTHDYSLTTALIAVGEKPNADIALLRDITIGNNVFIGTRSIIMPGTDIGNNVIIGAGSVVRGKIPDDSIYFGNPAVFVRNIKEQANKWNKYLDTFQIRMDKK